MSINLDPAEQQAISVIESYSDLRAPLYRLLDWPGLQGVPLALAMAAHVQMHRLRCATLPVSELALMVGISEDEVLKICKPRAFPLGVFRGPADDGRLYAAPSEALSYGERS